MGHRKLTRPDASPSAPIPNGVTGPDRSSRSVLRPRILLYSHDTMGIGHVRRNLLIAQALTAPPVSATVLLIAGAREAGAFSLPPNVDCLTLPSLHKTECGQYQPRTLGLALPDLIQLRGQSIAAAVKAFDPLVFIADKEPRGAIGELGPALKILRARNRTRCVLGIRDVLDDADTVRREWANADNEAVLREFYDAVWVYGDPTIYDPIKEYGFEA